MKIKQGVTYYLKEIGVAALVYYAVQVLLILVGATITVFVSGEGTITTNLEMSSAVFTFVWGILTFPSYIKFMLQNGISRRTMFISGALSLVVMSAGMGLLDQFIRLAGDQISQQSGTLFAILYLFADFSESMAHMNSFANILAAWLWSAALNLFLAFIGMLVGMLFYRLPKFGKILLGVGLGGSLLILLPLLEATVTHGRIVKAAMKFFLFVFGFQNPASPNPYVWVISSLVICTILAGFAYLLVRRAAPQKA